ncbi:TNF receptor-associated factor 3-like [Dendronephthya gigantea]|uniref:TNF receptor-associated factor 3-like n=1 Tax=Dendronephthya gigantea TaxID=151771 RepID=UPI00106D2B46|nr:TNF receptor-associated factor 3-like [Dendronephthya gigantea]
MDDEDKWLLAIDIFDEPRIDTSSVEVSCKFSQFGCQFKGVKASREMREHMKSKSQHHLSLMRQVVKYQEERIKKQHEIIAKHEGYLTNIMQVIKDYKEQFEEQRKQVNSQKTMLKDIQHDMTKLRATSRKQNKNLSETIEELSGKFDQFLLDYSASKACDDLQKSERYGEHLWIIRNYSRRLRRIQLGKSDDPIRSDPFYTGSPGYRLCTWVYLNGREKSLGGAISVYGKVMAGDFDSILRWPIRPQFTFTLYQQNCGDSERKDIVRRRRVHEIKRDRDEKSTITRSNGGIPRPLGDDRSIIVGFDNFVTHEELHTCGFLKGDNIFLKVEVEINV